VLDPVETLLLNSRYHPSILNQDGSPIVREGSWDFVRILMDEIQPSADAQTQHDSSFFM
jgi:hypothetical protein